MVDEVGVVGAGFAGEGELVLFFLQEANTRITASTQVQT